MTSQLGWSRASGLDSVYSKPGAILAVFVDDAIIAGTRRARQREWAALGAVLKLRGSPEPIDRFLGAKYVAKDTSTYGREVGMSQGDYARKIVERCDRDAPHPAGPRQTPAHKHTRTCDEPGVFAATCRSYIGSLMYLSRATRPDIAFATNWLARYVTSWSVA